VPFQFLQWIKSLFSGGAALPAIVFKRLDWEILEADLAELDFRARAGLVFEVTNPFSEEIRVDTFTPVLEARAGIKKVKFLQASNSEIVLKPGTHSLTLGLELDLSDELWKPLLGHDVEFKFRTEPRFIGIGDDVERLMDEWMQNAIEASGLTEHLGLPDGAETLAGLLGVAMDELWARLPFNPAGKGMELGFEWQVRLPKLPRLKPKSLSKLEIEPVGTRPMRLDLGFIEDSAKALDTLRNTLEDSVDLTAPAVSLLDILGEHMDGAATTTLNFINGFLPEDKKMSGSWNISSQLTKTGKQLVQAASSTAWAPFDEAVDGFSDLADIIPDKLVVPTALPTGLIFRLPLRIENPNHFPIELPAARLMMSGDAGTIFRVQLSAADNDPADDGEQAAGTSTRPFELEVEISWSAAGKELLDIIDSDNSTKFDVDPRIELRGDLGYGSFYVDLS